ncbi:MAG: hypothetical protein ABI707_04075 [Ferruginibacter sp.]
MIKNYFNTAWRNLLKDKLHSFINVLGFKMIIKARASKTGVWNSSSGFSCQGKNSIYTNIKINNT